MISKISLSARSRMYLLETWSGVYVWANEIEDRELSYENTLSKHIITINYCISGRCEVSLPEDNYIYMKPGMICLNSAEPENGFSYPTGHYTGLEIAFVPEILKDNTDPGLSDYVDVSDGIQKLLGEENEFAGGQTDDEEMTPWKELFLCLKEQQTPDNILRFKTLCVLYTFFNGGIALGEPGAYVTKGQRQIAQDAEKKISSDLSRRYTVTELADTYGVSPSALKQYFEKVYDGCCEGAGEGCGLPDHIGASRNPGNPFCSLRQEEI